MDGARGRIGQGATVLAVLLLTKMEAAGGGVSLAWDPVRSCPGKSIQQRVATGS